MGVLNNDTAQVQRAIARGVDVNNVVLNGDEAVAVWRDFTLWVGVNLSEDLPQEVIYNTLLEINSTPGSFNIFNFSVEMTGGILALPIVKNDIDTVNKLLNAGFILNSNDFFDFVRHGLYDPMRALLMQHLAN